MPEKVICFPMRYRVGKIRKTAKTLAGLKGKGADHYWRQTVAGLVGQLAKAGFSEFEIRGHIEAFNDAVQGHLQRAPFQNDGDAA
ncbi:DUF6074 family protein [Mesorhizobium sp.]|uniref:DUF6074 family protein n=1 Tax=Mesorhizobium sp. TaxID=1871066 RepID=UPI000FE7558B|nr:DUF6074 family protein [Mesorhizobium sp.]RWK53521.1 MAG: hypothetical protein EOR48_22230 [Mesorhizobium sp.]